MSKPGPGPKPSGDKLYVGHSQTMKQSPAWRAAPDHCRRVLDRVELEHMNHGLRKADGLCVTYDNFVEWGIPRAAVRLAVEQAVALGFLEIVRRGYSVKGEAKVPSLYRLTYAKQLGPDGKAVGKTSDEWRNIATTDAATKALRKVEADLATERDLRKQRKDARKAEKSATGGEKSPRQRAA